MLPDLRTDEARATKALVMINVGIFVLLSLLPDRAHYLVDLRYGLSGGGLAAGYWWQLVTHQFLHGSVIHILFNMVGLWFAGRELERVIGTRTFLALYFVGGIVGGLAQLVFVPSTPLLIGASGAVYAVLIALTAMFPNLPVTALIFFVLPIRMRAKYLGIGIVAATVVMWLSGFEGNVGHAAHLGGALVGYLFGRWFAKKELADPESFAEPAPVFGVARRMGDSAEGGRRYRGGGGRTVFEVVSPAAGSRGVDEILEKVLREGIDSLTREERAVLERARGQRPRRWG
jgi:membrane associated rhomboid family serine protease